MADPSQKLRFPELDALRGLAAVVVLIGHVLVGFYPAMHPRLPDVRPPWVRVWYDGDLAVQLFFVLSGFVLSLTYWQTGLVETLRSAAVRRYWRLFIPVAASVALGFVLVKTGAYANREAAAVTGQGPASWLAGHCGAVAGTAGEAVRQAAWETFFVEGTAGRYNAVLWTMRPEFLGSLVLFAFLGLTDGLRGRWLTAAVVGYAAHRLQAYWVLDFLAGSALCRLRVGRHWPGVPGWVAALMVVAGALGGSVSPAWFTKATGLKFVALAETYGKLAAAVLVLAGLLGSPALRRVCSAGPLVLLGRLSFPLYVCHLLVECSVGCRVYLAAVGTFGLTHTAAVVAAGAATLAVSLAVAWVGAVTVEPMSIWVGRMIYRGLFEPRPASVTAPQAVTVVDERGRVTGDEVPAVAGRRGSTVFDTVRLRDLV